MTSENQKPQLRLRATGNRRLTRFMLAFIVGLGLLSCADRHESPLNSNEEAGGTTAKGTNNSDGPEPGTAGIYVATETPAEDKDGMNEKSSHKQVVVNHTTLSAAEISAIEQRYGVLLVEGHYWYDRACGAWGTEGGPTLGFVMPGLQVGGALRADSSGGNTQVFINGRELHQVDVMGLQQLGPVQAGRYWVDANWNCGYEGGPALFNLAQLMRARSGGKGGAWSHTTKGFTDNTTVGGDGKDFMYVAGKDHHGNSYTYFP